MRVLPVFMGLTLVILVSFSAVAEETYRMPPQDIAAIVDAPPTPSVEVSPHKKWLLLKERPSMPSIDEVSQPELRLAGLRINPRSNGPSRRSYSLKMTLKDLSTLEERQIPLPGDARIGGTAWSPDGQWLAFSLTDAEGIKLWVAEVATGSARQLLDTRLNAALGSAYAWLQDSQTLVALTIPTDRSSPPMAPGTPTGPVVQENQGKKAPVRTFQDLLKNPHDEDLFDYYTVSQVVRVGLDQPAEPIGSPGIVTRISPSPDSEYLLVETLHRPYSYLVPYYRFPRRVEVWDLDGNLVHEAADLPLAEEIPQGFGAVAMGPRSFSWRADALATLYWVEALDGGDPKVEADYRDQVFMQPAPFEAPPVSLASLELRYSGVTWGRGDLALVRSSWWKTRQTRTWRIRPDEPAVVPELIFDRSMEDRYADPGSPLTRRTRLGTRVLYTLEEGDTVLLKGRGASPEGDRPFLRWFDLNTKEIREAFRSEAPYYENPVTLLDEAGTRILTSRETPVEPANYFIRDLETGKLDAVTAFPHPYPQMQGVGKELIRYKRDDGVDLTATLYLPSGYAPEQGPLPLILWAYPREFKSAAAAGQVRNSPHRFIRLSAYSPMLWLNQGYAVLDGPTMPIIGEGEAEPNDTFVKQLVASARAAIDEAVRRGVGDPGRVAVGGHSYGAFMTANLLAHSDLFRAGIARSGAYNRTLTPFGFQAEERTLWEAPDIYFAMSPFMHADKIREPILLIHGEADSNSGTFPLQSERFYHALKGLGATVRLVMLPHESHGYRARESVMHMLWETTEWLERHVKNASPEP